MRYIKGMGAWWFLHLIQRPKYISPWSKIYQLTLWTYLYNKKCDIKYPGGWIGLNRAFQGGNERREREGVNLHAPGRQYIVHGCPIDITKPGGSQWGLQGSKNATTERGLTRCHTELQTATHQWKEDTRVVQGEYMNSMRVIWDTVMDGKISTRGTGGKTTKTWKIKRRLTRAYNAISWYLGMCITCP